jgi:hypothetical protein
MKRSKRHREGTPSNARPSVVTTGSPEQALERMKALTRRVLAAPKPKRKPKRKHR